MPDLRSIGDLVWREPATVAGQVRSVCIQPRAGIPTLEATVWDPTGGITVVWLGRRRIPGIHPGTHVRLSGVVGDHHGRLAYVNPVAELL